MIKKQLSKEIINKTLNYFDDFKIEECVVKPSFPILYFGDLNAYFQSEKKIITVGKNPSDNEFRNKKDEPFSFFRFPKWNKEERNLVESLNDYFETQPLKKWFDSFEPILEGFQASYYRNKSKNIALHTDICSPLATNPTWSKLSRAKQTELSLQGFEIWKDLINELEPDILLISIPRKLLEQICKKEEKKIIGTFYNKKNGEERNKPYLIEEYSYLLNNEKKVKVLFGAAANTPFGTISTEQKKQINKLCQK